MKQKKDGKYLNCYIDKNILEQFEAVCDMLGKTKTKVLEEAMQREISLYCKTGVDGKTSFNPKPGIFIDDEGNESPCTILYDTTMMGNPYVAIMRDSHVVKVPESKVKEV